MIIGGAVLAAAVVGIMASCSGGEDPAPKQQEEVAVEPEAPREDLTSWDGTLQKLVRRSTRRQEQEPGKAPGRSRRTRRIRVLAVGTAIPHAAEAGFRRSRGG